jgi:hypothetical protein
MRKLITLLLLSFTISFGYAQTERTRSTGSFTETDGRGKFISNLIIPRGTTPTLNGGLNQAGQLFFNTTDNKLYAYNGTIWNVVNQATDLSNYYTKTEVDAIFAQNISIAKVTGLQTALNGKYNKFQVDSIAGLKFDKTGGTVTGSVKILSSDPDETFQVGDTDTGRNLVITGRGIGNYDSDSTLNFNGVKFTKGNRSISLMDDSFTGLDLISLRGNLVKPDYTLSGGAIKISNASANPDSIEISSLLSLKNHKISNLANGTALSDAVNKSQLDLKANTSDLPTKTSLGLNNVPNTDFTSAVTANTAKNSYPSGDATKLAGIATGATANQTDAYLLARANHTGTQSVSTITGLATVATSGSYIDLSSKPTIPTNADYVDKTSNQLVSGNKTYSGIANYGTIVAAGITSLNNTSIAISNNSPKFFTVNKDSLAFSNASGARYTIKPGVQTTMPNNYSLTMPDATGTLALTSQLPTKTTLGLNNVDNTSDLNKPISTATQTALNLKEPTITKNTAFNKNFGTTAGTVAEGNYSPAKDGTGATGTWGINISGNAATATNSTKWANFEYDNTTYVTNPFIGLLQNSVTGKMQPARSVEFQSFLGLGSAAYINADASASDNTIVKRSGNGLALISGGYLESTLIVTDATTPTDFATFSSGGVIRKNSPSAISSLLGLGSNAFNSTAYLPLSGGNVSGMIVSSNPIPFQFRNGSSLRWELDREGAESGSNNGSNLRFYHYDDSGGYLGWSLLMNRNTGNVDFGAGISTVGTATFGGALNGTSASFTSTVTAATPTASNHLTTKAYVDARTTTNGNLTPTLTGITNVTSTSNSKAIYSAIGNYYTETGSFTVVATAGVNTEIKITTYFPNTGNYYGTGSVKGSTINLPLIIEAATAEGDGTSNVKASFIPLTSGTYTVSYTFTADTNTP